MNSDKLKTKLTNIGLLTGKDGLTDTTRYQVGGCDLGYPAYDHKQGRLLFFFGDSFSSSGSFAEGWRSQTVGVAKDLSFKGDRLPIEGFLNDGDGRAISVIDGHHEDNFEMTKIPTGAVVVDGTIYVFHFSIRSWSISDPGKRMNFGGLIKSRDGGCTWARVPGIVFANHVAGEHSDYLQRLINEDIDRKPAYDIDLKEHFGYHFTSIYPKWGPDGYVYLFGEASFDADGIKLARVPASQIEDYEAYEYLIKYDNGQPIYERGATGRIHAHEASDNYVLKERSREISIVYNEFLKKWMLFKISETGGIPELVFYLANELHGPYHQRHAICPKQDPRFGGATVYAPLTCEEMMRDGGRTIYLLLSQWLPIYNPMLIKLEIQENDHDQT